MTIPNRDRFIHSVDLYLIDTEAIDNSGGLTQTRTLIKAGITCLVTGQGGGRRTQAARDQEEKPTTVHFPDAIDIKQGHYLMYTTPTGKVQTLMVDSFHDDQEQGRLWVANCTHHVDPIAE